MEKGNRTLAPVFWLLDAYLNWSPTISLYTSVGVVYPNLKTWFIKYSSDFSLSSLHRKLYYPFSIPVGSSYACRTDEISTSHIISNPNRFVQIGNSTGDNDIIDIIGEGGPVVQFTGLHVRECTLQ